MRDCGVTILLCRDSEEELREEVSVPGTIELVGFMQLQARFRDRGWANPHRWQLDREVDGPELLDLLDVPAKDVEVIFVNHTAFPMDQAIIHPGDRVALAPPGVPGPHRLLLGFKNKAKAPEKVKDEVPSR